MIGKKLLKGIDRTARAALAVGLTALVSVSVWAGVTYLSGNSEDQRPTLLFRCMDFKLVEDGTIQALVRVSAENMPYFTGTAFNIEYNPYYIQPSYLDTDTVPGHESQVLVSGANSEFYVDDPALEKIYTTTAPSGRSPFATASEMSAGETSYARNEVILGDPDTGTNGKVSVYLTLYSSLAYTQYTSQKYADGKQDVVQTTNVNGLRPWEPGYRNGSTLTIDASGTVDENGRDNYDLVLENGKLVGAGTPGNGVNLGTLSFQVNADNLTEMVTNYNKFKDTPIPGEPNSFLIGYPVDDEGNKLEDWAINDLINKGTASRPSYVENKRKPEGQEDSTQGPWGDQGNKNDESTWARVVFEFIFPKTLVKAEVAGGSELTVNAYQAYNIGTIADIATTLQRYRPEVTGTYADATEENFVFNWGDTASDYTVYRPYVIGVDTGDPDYTDRMSGRDWMKLTPAEYTTNKMFKAVDPYQEYMVTQKFYYEEDDTTKVFPYPMEVNLKVTPVNLVDANADKLTATYLYSVASGFNTSSLTQLELPNQAILAMSPVPAPIVFAMPITTWQPSTIGGLTTGGTPSQSQNWPTVGDYTLNGPTAQNIINYVEGAYPWATTTGFDKSIVATRTIIADDPGDREPNDPDPDIYYVAEYVSTDDDSQLELKVTKMKDQTAVDYETSTNFRTYLPNGMMIKTADPNDDLPEVPYNSGNPSSPGANGALSAKERAGDNKSYDLYYYPGTPYNTADPRSSHQEDVARFINLGGWFYVSVDEGSGWSDLIPVYVPPRTNYYTPVRNGESYYNDGQDPDATPSPDPGTAEKYYNFDFTGLQAGLYPFYVDSTLPERVVLPIGYTVTTTYDGSTGAEPGLVGEFEVAEWAAAQADDPTHTTTLWDEGAIINHGDPGDPTASPDPVAAAPEDPTDLADAVYAAYGAVENHQGYGGGSGFTHTTAGLEKVHMRVQVPAAEETESPEPTPTPTPSESPEPTDSPEPTPSESPEPTPGPGEKPEEHIRLIHEDSVYTTDRVAGITRTGDEVERVTYTLQQEGYIVRQTYTLTIVNDGDTDIYGLSIDVVNGVHTPSFSEDGLANHFEILRQPAPYLPAGGQTTFVITYIYNLKDMDPSSAGTHYEDHILITSNGYDKTNPLKNFIADFEVTGDDIYKVTVVIEPDPATVGVTMGSAGIIEGPTDQPASPSGGPYSSATEKPDHAEGTDTYVAGHKYVWIEAEAFDEYQIRRVYYIDYDNQNDPVEVDLYTYEWEDAPESDTVYFFEMPAHDTTVVVEFYEPIYAKLRLSRLMGYAGTAGDIHGTYLPGTEIIENGGYYNESLIDTADLDQSLNRHNIRWYSDATQIIQTDPAYTDSTDGFMVMTPADSSRPPVTQPTTHPRRDYLMVIGDYANNPNAAKDVNDLIWVQLQARLRLNSLDPDIDDVIVNFYEYDLNTGSRINPLSSGDEHGKTWHLLSPNAPTSHDSYIVSAPVSNNGEMAEKAIEIELKCTITQDMIDYDPAYGTGDLGAEVTRSFVVVIVRASQTFESKLNYGNSPKGMIYNDKTLLTATAKQNVWNDFLNNGSSFVGLSDRPSKTTGLDNTYWVEAWGNMTYNGNSYYNGDRDEYALFVILGQPFQDPGFATLKNTIGFDVDPSTIVRTVEVAQLDTAATSQVARFNGLHDISATSLELVTLELGAGDEGLVTSGSLADVINNWWQLTDETGTTDYAVRPDVYTLIYTFPDYNGDSLTVTRPIIILAPVGDVNADRVVNKNGAVSDVDYIRNRVTDPLGGMMSTALDYSAWRLFRYRVCDVNNDRNLNNIDANRIRSTAPITAFYKPTDYISPNS